MAKRQIDLRQVRAKILCSYPEAAALLNVSLRGFYNMVPTLPPDAVAQIGPKKVAARVAVLEAYANSLPAPEPGRPEPEQLRRGKEAKRRGAGTPGVGSSCGAAGQSSESEDSRGPGRSPSPSNSAEVAA